MLRELTDSHPIVTAIVALVIATIGFIGWNNFLFSGLGQLTNDARVIAAIITTSGAIFGVIIAGIISIAREVWSHRRERRSVATALLLETYSQCDSIANCGSIANAALKTSSPNLKLDEFIVPAKPRVFMALAPRISTLPTNASRSVIAFYSSTQAANVLAKKSPEVALPDETQSEFHKKINQQKQNLSIAYKLAAHYGLQAMTTLEKFSDINKDERKAMESLKEELSLIATKDAHPRVMLQT